MNLLEQFREQCAELAIECGYLGLAQHIGALPLPEDEQQTRHFKNGDEIITSLYRRFKDWSKRGFSADDVTWCEVRAEVYSLINMPIPSDAEALRKENEILSAKIDNLKNIISSDAYVISFQSIGQYRSALLKEINK